MVDRLRSFLNRPLNDTDRPRLFAVAVAVIVVAAGLLAWREPRSTPRRAQPVSTAPIAFSGSAAPPVTAVPSATSSAASEEGGAPARSAGSRADVAGAKRAGRQFLAGYLPYSYGRARASRIQAVTRGLRQRLARQRPRVPARERRLRPRLVLLQSDAVSHRRAQLLALVGDGARRYTLRLELSHTRRGWIVTDVRA